VAALVMDGSDAELLDGILDVVVLNIVVRGELGPDAVDAHRAKFRVLQEKIAPASDRFDRLLDAFSEGLFAGEDTPECRAALDAFYEQRGLGMVDGIVWGAMLPGAALAQGHWRIPPDVDLRR
jgi:hypothetical protein